MGRFLWIQIYDSNNEEVEYDNTVDTDWGITLGTATLDRMIMGDELSFGKFMPNMFQIQIFGIDATLNGRKIVVRLDYVEEGYNLITDNNELLVTENGDRIITTPIDNPDTVIFTGYILTSTFDNSRTYRDLVCYDRAYTDNETNIVDFWNTYWTGKTTVTLKALRTALLNYMGITYIDKTLINDGLYLKNNFVETQTLIKFGDIIRMICVLQNCCPNIRGDGILEFVKFGENTYDLTGNIEGLNSNWSDYTTDTITGVGVYYSSDELSQLVGTGDNVYKLTGNVLVSDKTASETTAYCTPILNELATINYTPMDINLVISDVYYNLGDKIHTAHGDAYIMQQTFSGSILIDENIKCNAIDKKLSDYVDDESDLLANMTKRARLEHDLDVFSVDYADFKENTEAEFELTSETIVLKVTSRGRIVQAEFGSDPDTGTEFTLTADNINLTANNIFNIISNHTMNLTSKAIQISSTNFSVTTAGVITAKSGQIGPWKITTKDMYDSTADSGVGAGIGKNGTSPAFWAGTSYGDRANAPFRVTHGGKVTCTNADVTGKITATSGKIGDWTIAGTSLETTTTSPSGSSVSVTTLSKSVLQLSNSAGSFYYNNGRITMRWYNVVYGMEIRSDGIWITNREGTQSEVKILNFNV